MFTRRLILVAVAALAMPALSARAVVVFPEPGRNNIALYTAPGGVGQFEADGQGRAYTAISPDYIIGAAHKTGAAQEKGSGTPLLVPAAAWEPAAVPMIPQPMPHASVEAPRVTKLAPFPVWDAGQLHDVP